MGSRGCVFYLLLALLSLTALAAEQRYAEPEAHSHDPEREVRDSYHDIHGGGRPHERNLRESIIADAVKSAVADVIRGKAESDYGGSSSSSQRSPLPRELLNLPVQCQLLQRSSRIHQSNSNRATAQSRQLLETAAGAPTLTI
jgi:hypothetical protein